MTLRSALYRALSFSNDVRAVSRGPKATARRVVRKRGLRLSRRAVNRGVKWLIP